MGLKIRFYRLLYSFTKATGIKYLQGAPTETDVIITEDLAKLHGIKEVELAKIQDLHSNLEELRNEYEGDYQLLTRLKSELSRAQGKKSWSVMDKYLKLIEQKDARTSSMKKNLIRKVKEL